MAQLLHQSAVGFGKVAAWNAGEDMSLNFSSRRLLEEGVELLSGQMHIMQSGHTRSHTAVVNDGFQSSR
ncbi:MAG: hypothetical protein AABZ01_05730, partial [Gemmatimonadota bacterium]